MANPVELTQSVFTQFSNSYISSIIWLVLATVFSIGMLLLYRSLDLFLVIAKIKTPQDEKGERLSRLQMFLANYRLGREYSCLVKEMKRAVRKQGYNWETLACYFILQDPDFDLGLSILASEFPKKIPLELSNEALFERHGIQVALYRSGFLLQCKNMNGNLAQNGVKAAIFFGIWRRNRRERPFAGLLMIFSALRFVSEKGDPSPAQKAMRDSAEVLQEMIAFTQKSVGQRLPLYVLISSAQEIYGFKSFTKALPLQLRSSALGWSTPQDPEEHATHLPAIDEIRDDFLGQLRHLVDEILVEHTEVPGDKSIFVFASQLEAVTHRAHALIERMQIISRFHEGAFLRGLYYVGHHEDFGFCYFEDLLVEKIFAEHGLAVPAKGLLTASTLRNTQIKLVTALGLLFLTGGVFVGLRRAQRHSEEAYTLLKDVAPAMEKHHADRKSLKKGTWLASQSSNEPVRLLGQLSRLQEIPLRFLFVPGTWRGIHSELVTDSVELAYRDLVLDVMEQSMHRKVHEVAGILPQTKVKGFRNSTLLSLENWDDFLSLKEFVADMHGVFTLVHKFNEMTREKNAKTLSELVNTLYGTHVDLKLIHPQVIFSSQSENAIFDEKELQALTDAGRRRLREHFERFFVHLEGLPEIVTDVSEIQQALGKLHVNSLAASEEDFLDSHTDQLPHLMRLEEAFTSIEKKLGRTELDWISAEDFSKIPEMESLFKAIEGTPVFGEATAKEYLQAGKLRFQRLKNQLYAQQLQNIGALFQTEKGGTMKLSPVAQALAVTLHSFLKQPFVRNIQRSGVSLATRNHGNAPGTSDPLVALREATDLCNSYIAFESGLSKNVPQEFLPSLVSASQKALNTSLKISLHPLLSGSAYMKAAHANDGVSTFDIGGLDQLIATLPMIENLLTKMALVGLNDLSDELVDSFAGGIGNGLGKLELLLQQESLYSPRHGNFVWWNGLGSPLPEAFGVRDSLEARDLLAEKRLRISKLAERFARPFITFLTKHAPPQESYLRGQPSIPVWKGILQALDDKSNTGSLGRLEDFIAETLAKVTLDDCVVTTGKESTSQKADYFARHLQHLRTSLSSRCQALKDSRFLKRYQDLRDTFVRNLEGNYPFAPNRPEHFREELESDTLRSFFQSAGNLETPFEGIMQRAAKGDQSTKPAAQFVQSLQKTKTFLEPLLNDDVAALSGQVTLHVDFRPQKSREIATGGIVEWALESGSRRVTNQDLERTLKWSVGEPLRFVLRWAKDAPVDPMPDPKNPFLFVNGKTAVFEYRNRWALLALLRNHALINMKDSERGQPSYLPLLRFMVPLKEPGSALSAYNTSRTFVRIEVRHPEKNTVLTLPPLPEVAPDIKIWE
jgi:type VI secretion system protein ImpL